ncbi:MAG: Eco57I restriction-modification methylase domain-containing protein [Ectothiorhodospiraceae bacterium]|nr:Eco57I restriction-modification methylase domain-containing protein [Ectothiorhodospiraceae bacterium]
MAYTDSNVRPTQTEATPLLEQVETIRLEANTQLDENQRSELGQFMTPAPLARLMASMFNNLTGDIHLLDAGAGVGSLTTAVTEEACNRFVKPRSITANTYELDTLLTEHLKTSMQLCQHTCTDNRIDFKSNILNTNFIDEAVTLLQGDVFSERLAPRFNRVILNPPYYKINSGSTTRQQLSSVGIETVNLYAAFVALSIKLLEDGGELVAITPRSFCNGPYFKPFRQLLFGQMTIKQIHIFKSRNKAFKGDTVLQENIIFHAIKEQTDNPITITSSSCAEDKEVSVREVSQQNVVCRNDPDMFIHIPTSKEDGDIAVAARSLPCSLNDLGLKVSTGRVVDFRAKEYLQMEPSTTTVPLIYPTHFKQGFIAWPKTNSRKPNALKACSGTDKLMVPSGVYTLVKRFSSKEERRRIVAAVFDPKKINSQQIGFENHLNYFHNNGKGLSLSIAKGLALFLNSSLVDQYFRQFNGHTQVNATDLRSLRYPTLKQLKQLGSHYKSKLPEQDVVDKIIEKTLFCQN